MRENCDIIIIIITAGDDDENGDNGDDNGENDDYHPLLKALRSKFDTVHPNSQLEMNYTKDTLKFSF